MLLAFFSIEFWNFLHLSLLFWHVLTRFFMRIRHLASIMKLAYKNVESLAKDLSNTKAVLDIGWSNNEK